MTVRVMLMTGSLGPGGTELAVATLARELAARGRVSPRLVVLGEGGADAEKLRKEGVPVEELGIRGSLRSLAAWRQLRELEPMMRHERVRIVHTFLFDADVYGMLAARRGDPWAIVTTRRALKKRFLHRLGYRLTNAFVDRIVCNSEAVARFTLQKEGAPKRKVVVIPNGVDLARFATGDRAATRARFGAGEADLLVGAVGTIKHVKGQAVLVEAMIPLLAQHPGVKLVLAGEVTPGYGESLRERANAAGMAGRILFTGVQRDVPALLAALDVFALPSLSEGMSNALLEAMAAGKPIVATDAGGNAECLAAGACGLVVPPGDPAALGAALGKVLADAGLRRALGEAARGRAHAEYALGRMLDRTEGLYAELLGRSWQSLMAGEGNGDTRPAARRA